jgi:hypothetical protein
MDQKNVEAGAKRSIGGGERRLRRGAGARSSAPVGVPGGRPGRVGVSRHQAVLEAVRIDAAILGPGLSEGTSRRGEEERERRRSNGLGGHVSSPFSSPHDCGLERKMGSGPGDGRESLLPMLSNCARGLSRRRAQDIPINTSSSRSRDPRLFGRHGRKALGRRAAIRSEGDYSRSDLTTRLRMPWAILLAR